MSGIIVTGPPRSGTSGTTRLLDLAGAHVTTAGDRLGGGPNNPTGHWESRSVLAINNRLLERAGARWWCAPDVAIDIDLDVDDVEDFRRAHPGRPWLCKDPRFSITLQSWRRRLDDLVAVVVVLRRPDEAVASMRRSWPMTVEHATAVWTRALVAALGSSRGLPVAVIRFPDVTRSTRETLAPIVATGARLGLTLAMPEANDVEAFVVPPRGASERYPLPDDAWQLWERVASAPEGFHRSGCDLVEPPWVEQVLSGFRSALGTSAELDMTARLGSPREVAT